MLNRRVCIRKKFFTLALLDFFPLSTGMDSRDVSENRKNEIQLELKIFPFLCVCIRNKCKEILRMVSIKKN